jgi:hypothetical protein
VNKCIPCHGRAISYKTGEKLCDNSLFLPELINDHKNFQRVDWSPEDYALFPNESKVAKDVDSLPKVIAFLRFHGLPCEPTTVGPRENEAPSALVEMLKKYEGKRVKVRGFGSKDQFFLWRGQLHYLELSAALVCDELNLAFIEIEAPEMELLAGARGSDLNAAQMRSVLKRV